MHNIAEGFDGGSNAEFVRFLHYSQRSASELQSQLYVALDRGHIGSPSFEELYELAAHARSKVGGFIASFVLKPVKFASRSSSLGIRTWFLL